MNFVDYSNGELDSPGVNDYVDNDNLIKMNSNPIESSNLMEFYSPLRNHVNWHLRKSNSDESIKTPNYRSLNSYHKNRNSPRKIIIHPLIPNINAYLQKYKINLLTHHRPSSKDRQSIKIRPHKFFSLRPPMKDGVNKGRTYTYSYSDGHGKNLNINVYHRNNLTKSTASKDNDDSKFQNGSNEDIRDSNDHTDTSESLED
ncbi:hypothetical protein G9C98_004904 [Cotesia typhae]|uniref:Uncharacterized protein n=1 Tax=Cotesia typhae TaxID=2053667 RepID=A0A8J5UYR2_9HYME|nr:hypothetical protein G9C98_004904 [Cotesia typhae]